MGKEKDRHSELEQYSRGRLRMLFSEWVVNSLDQEDYAFDFEVRPTGFVFRPAEVTPAPFFVQLKASERFDDDAVWWDVDVEFLEADCLAATIPVVLAIYERQSDEFYACVLQRYCWDVLDDDRPDWRDQSSVRIRIPRTPLHDRGPNHGLRCAVDETQRRITARAHVATARRVSFERPPGTELATTAKVTEYKRDLVEEARIYSDAGRTDRAIRKAMQVYQLPEQDEPTLDAIELLLDLRALDGPATAFPKQRLARHGLRLAETYGRNEFKDELDEVYETAWACIEEELVGATYRNTQNGQEFLVLDVRQRTDGGTDEPVWVASVQYAVGELEDEDARSIVSNDAYELVESGTDQDPLETACEERNHTFPAEALREYAPYAICTDCGLSRDTLRQLLKHDVPSECADCGRVVYDTDIERREADEFVEEVELCPNCVA